MKYYYKTRCYKIKYMNWRYDEMEVGYEPKFDQLVVILPNDYKYSHSYEAEGGFILDFDENQDIAAVEILDCSKKIGATKKYVKEAKVNVSVEEYEMSYKIIVDFNDGDKELVKQIGKWVRCN